MEQLESRKAMIMLICADFVGKNKEGRVGTVEVRVGGVEEKIPTK